ncbi:hypothetical protein K3495_g3809 [Podosphaera aphanis]|nr:hypothetical protein K3495_g3809 [Podosphaera aphanis]
MLPRTASIPQLVSHVFIIPPPMPAGLSGIPEVRGCTQGYSSLESNPSLVDLTSANKNMPSPNSIKHVFNVSRNKLQREGSTHNIREECERLFCETMKVTFLGAEGRLSKHGSYVMSVGTRVKNAHKPYQEGFKTSIDVYLVIWDYLSGCRFRGFVGGQGTKKSLFIFFEPSVLVNDLKQGLIALIELAESVFDLSKVVICLERSAPEKDCLAFVRNLRWVGFEPITLELWSNSTHILSDRWLFLGMQI